MITRSRKAKLERIRKLAAGEPEGITTKTIIVENGIDRATGQPPVIDNSPGVFTFVVNIIDTEQQQSD